MIVIGANVISELMRLPPSPAVRTWFAGKDSAGRVLPFDGPAAQAWQR